MGLREKKATKEFLDNRYESLKKQIDKEAGFDVKIDVDWDTLAVDDYAEAYDETWPKVYFQPIIKAFKEICSEDFAREALEEGLEKIVIHNHSDNYYASKWAVFKKGVLTLNHSPTTNVNQVQERAEYIKYIVEKDL